MVKIYVSSTYRDLEHYRRAVCDTLRQAGYEVIGMEDYPAVDQRPLDKCRQDVANCDIYVGIFAWFYGYIPHEDNPDGMSITELEYRHASLLGKQRLIFLLREDVPWSPMQMERDERRARIEALRAELGRKHTVKFFESRDDLAAKVAASVAYFLSTSQVSALPQRLDEMSKDFSGVPRLGVAGSAALEIENVIGNAISNIRTSKLLEIDLGVGLSWWSTRLYLLSSLASDYTQVKQLVFIGQGYFAGMASPVDIRHALARIHPIAETAYRRSFPEPMPGPSLLPHQLPPAVMSPEVDLIVHNFCEVELPNAIQQYHPGLLREDEIKIWVTAEQLRQWLGPQWNTDSIAFQPMDMVMLSQIIDRHSPFVAITQEEKLVQVIDRTELAVKVANLYFNETLRAALRLAHM